MSDQRAEGGGSEVTRCAQVKDLRRCQRAMKHSGWHANVNDVRATVWAPGAPERGDPFDKVTEAALDAAHGKWYGDA